MCANTSKRNALNCQTCSNHKPCEYTGHRSVYCDCRYIPLELIDFIVTATIEFTEPPTETEIHTDNTTELPWSEARLLIEREQLMHRIYVLIYHQKPLY